MSTKNFSFRGQDIESDILSLGCSHTWGIGVECHETWPYLLNAKNLGLPGISSDTIVRMARDLIPKYSPRLIYCLWPDWSRFEYEKQGEILQSLPTDSNRIEFMKTHDDQWCRQNFAKNVTDLRSICDDYSVELVDMTLYDLIPFIDHADRWPLSKLGHHYSPIWHRWIADIFQQAYQKGIKFSLAYE